MATQECDQSGVIHFCVLHRMTSIPETEYSFSSSPIIAVSVVRTATVVPRTDSKTERRSCRRRRAR